MDLSPTSAGLSLDERRDGVNRSFWGGGEGGDLGIVDFQWKGERRTVEERLCHIV